MAPLRFRPWLLLLALLLAEGFFLPLNPLLDQMLDPLLLVLIFLGVQRNPLRSLWGIGAGLGLFKDLAGGGLFGAWMASFALIAYLLSAGRHLVEWEDRYVQAAGAGLLAGLGWLAYGLVTALVDSEVGWNRWWWVWLPVFMGAQGMLAYAAFPRFKKILNG